MAGWIVEENSLTAEEFIELSQAVGWGVHRVYDMTKVQKALADTTYTVVVRDSNRRILACARVFSDDLLMTFIPDIFVRPENQKNGLGKTLIEKLKEKYGHTRFFFGSQPENEVFFEKLGFEKSIQSYTGRFSVLNTAKAPSKNSENSF